VTAKKEFEIITTKKEIMIAIKNRRENNDPSIKKLEMYLIVRKLKKNKISIYDINEATDEEKKIIKDLSKRWENENTEIEDLKEILKKWENENTKKI
jgi:hypothetical protein